MKRRVFLACLLAMAAVPRAVARGEGRPHLLALGCFEVENVGSQFLSLRRDSRQNGSADRHHRSEIATTSRSPEHPVVLKTHVSAKLWTPR
jgi:hypothetical protein